MNSPENKQRQCFKHSGRNQTALLNPLMRKTESGTKEERNSNGARKTERKRHWEIWGRDWQSNDPIIPTDALI